MTDEKITISLEELIDENKSKWVKPKLPGVNPDFEVLISYIPASKYEELREKNLRLQTNPTTGTKEWVLDTIRFFEDLLREVVKDWKNLKVKDLIHLIPIKEDVFKKIPPETEVNFSEKNLLLLAKHSSIFTTWVSGEVNNVSDLNEVDLEGNF